MQSRKRCPRPRWDKEDGNAYLILINISKHVPDTVLNTLYALPQLINTNLWNKYYYFTHFTDENAEFQRSNDFPKVTQLICRRNSIETQTCVAPLNHFRILSWVDPPLLGSRMFISGESKWPYLVTSQSLDSCYYNLGNRKYWDYWDRLQVLSLTLPFLDVCSGATTMLQGEDMKKMDPVEDVVEAGQNDEGTQWHVFWGTDEEMGGD